MTTADRSLRERIRRLDPMIGGLALVTAVVPAWYLSWLLADFGLRGVGFLLGWIGVSWVLANRNPPRELGITWLRIIAGLLLLTPVFLVLPFVMNADRFGVGNLAGFVLTESNLITILVFALLAAIPAGIAQWLARIDVGSGA